ncbi:MAG: sialidase family protein, partial [Rhodopirellula bahusiensis]
LLKADWPTEPAAVSLGDGRILAVARTESGPAQFQMVSTDNGATWKRHQTNISDIYASTPSLILDAETGLLSNYYYERGRGILRRRVVAPNIVFDNPLHWPASEAVATGSQLAWDSGNANATFIGDTHYVSFYSGEAPDTAVMLSELPEPTVAP